jgi:L,D-transpeptidase ErfK/SrfK
MGFVQWDVIEFKQLWAIGRNDMKRWTGFAIVLGCLGGPAGATVYELPENGSAVFGTDERVKSTYQDTLLDIARRYSLGYEEIIRANPGVDMWLPGEGRDILLPGRRILPAGPREGVVVNLPEHRLDGLEHAARRDARYIQAEASFLVPTRVCS